ncbi:MAG: amino acid adenylation domain-containing protein [Candidatus Sulfotelmatobacter sp.]
MSTSSGKDRLRNLPPAKRALLVQGMRDEAANRQEISRISRRAVSDRSPLSFAQQRLWFLDQLEPGKSYYNVSFALKLDGLLNLPALESSLNEIARRHEILRATFTTVAGEPVQVITPQLRLELPVIDLSPLPEEECQLRIRDLAGIEAQKPFDLTAGPLLRLLLLRTREREHLLLPTFHHIVFDGWSVGIFTEELTNLYEAYSNNRSSPLPELPIQYADYTLWQRERLPGESLEQLVSYWKRQLRDAPPVLEMPTDFSRSANQAVSSASYVITLPPSLSDSLKQLSRQEDVTLFMTLLAAFELLLYRYSGQKDVVIGSSIANRTRAEIEGLIGFFVNTLVLRTDFAGQPSFRQLLERVKTVTMEAYAHQNLPFEKLVEELQPERSLGHTPLFQVMFALQNQPRLSTKPASIQIIPLDFESGAAKFDLTFVMMDTDNGLRARMEYNAALFQPETIRQMLESFRTLLESAVADVDCAVHSLPMLGHAARQRLLFGNNQRREASSKECIHQVFAKQAARTPERPAVVFEKISLSFEELNQRSNKLARYLERLGVGPDVVVGLCCERSLEMVTGLLGILKAGGAYMPLDPATPAEKLSFMLADTRAKVLLTHSETATVLPDHEVHRICVDTDWDRISCESSEEPINRSSEKNLAYIIFTSGSTGRPKAVAVEHRQLRNYVNSVCDKLELPFPANYALVSTLAADLGHTMLFPSLSGGGTLHLISHELATDPEGLADYFQEREIDCLKIVPSHLSSLMLSARPERLLPRKRLVLGGEASAADWIAAIRKLDPRCRIFNHYGPTETTVGVLTNEIGNEPIISPSVPLGTPLANTQVYVLDSTLEPVPAGVKGEIYIGGEGLSRGYLNLPAVTAEKFIPDPIGEKPGARLYRTGDLGRYLHSGKIEFLGRLDHQVKYHGYRIELEEVRNALKRHVQIRDAVVKLVKDKDGTDVLVAYYVSRQEIEVSEIRSKLKESIMEETLPTVFVHLRKLPLTLNGKINHASLPSWNEARLKTQRDYVAPRTLTEEAVCEIWCRLLKLQSVGVHDNFFELGGHSLLATRLISQLREAFRVSLPLRDLFETPTVEGLANTISDLWGGGQTADEVVRIVKETSQLSGEELSRMASSKVPAVSR